MAYNPPAANAILFDLQPYTVGALNFELEDQSGNSLTATPIRAATTTGRPAIGQVHGLTATALVSGSTTGTPTAAQANVLAATGLAISPTTGRPAIGQTHALTPLALRCGASTGTPTAGIVTIVYDLSATAPVSGATTGRPAIGQTHSLAAVAIKAAPVLDQPALYVGIGVTATPLRSGSLVGAPVLRVVSPTQFIALDLRATHAAPLRIGASTSASRPLRCSYRVEMDGDMPTRTSAVIRGSTKITEVLQ